MEMQAHDELLDQVNEHDEVVGQILRSQAYKENLLASIRSTWLFIQNAEGKLWIPRRNLTKANNPGCLDGSVVGHVGADESYEQAMIREAQEELRLDITKYPYKKIAKLSPQKHGTLCHCEVFLVEINDMQTFDFNAEDIHEGHWMLPREVLHRIQQGEKTKSMLPVILKNCF